MKYSQIVEVYESLSKTNGKIEKAEILSKFFIILDGKSKYDWIYLLKGKVAPDYDSREFGISRQLVLKAISRTYGIDAGKVLDRFKKIGDLGELAYEYSEKRKQGALFSEKLDVEKVFSSLKKIMDIEGDGAVDKKLGIISELLGNATPSEAKYIIRTLLNDLRIGVADGIIRDALNKAFGNSEEDFSEKVQSAYDMTADFSLVFREGVNQFKDFEKISIFPGRAFNVMLSVKVESIDEGFEVCGKPCAFEYKYDGFRMVISKSEGKINLFTRRLENVTNQFPDVVEYVKKNVHGENFILDSEVVGFEPKSGKYMPFQYISQRIKRKYDIEKIIDKLPVEVNVFDVLYLNDKSLLKTNFIDRRKILEKILKQEKRKIVLSKQIVTDSVEEAEDFYNEALKVGEEGVMVKKLDAPYQPGRRVGYLAKLKPNVNDLDLVIVGAEHGTGKRAGWLSSYIVACKDGDKFLEIGKVSSGLKEKEEEGTTYEEMTKLLKPLVIEDKGSYFSIKPKIIVSVTYQNIQKSPSYSSGYALRFPRITAYRPDRSFKDIASLREIEKEIV